MSADRTALITGVAGQDGIYLARLLRSQGWRVVGTVRSRHSSTRRVAPYLEGVTIVEHDVTDEIGFAELLDQFTPSAIYNLAAFSSVRKSWDDPELVVRTNAVAVTNMLEGLLRYRDSTRGEVRFFHASTAEIFGSCPYGALNEESSHQPNSPYAVAKSAAHFAVAAYREKYGLFACNGILFNHESPLRGLQFVAGKIVRTAAEVAAGKPSQISLGNIDVGRDWGAAVDFVDVMPRILGHQFADDYIIATGTTHTLRQMLVAAFDAAGLDDPMRYVSIDSQLMPPVQQNTVCGDPSKAHKNLDWSAKTSFNSLISEMVDVDRRRLQTGVAESADYLC